MFIFGLRSTSDDWPSDLSIKHDQNAENWKRPLKSLKNKMFLDYVQFLMIRRAIWTKTLSEMQKNEKGPLSHWKIKCSFLDYIQFLMIDWVISTENIDRNAKKWKRPPKSSKNKMFIFGLCSTSDDWPSNPSKKCWPKHKKQKRPPKSSKDKMFIFGLHSTSDDQLSNLSKKHWPRCKKMKKAP